MELGSSRSSAGRVGASAAQVQDPTSAAGRDRPDQRKVFRVADHAGVALAGLTAIFLHELQPILANHLQTQTATTGNTCVVACGAAAAKDHLFKGSQEQPGLVTIAMEEILRFAASDGGTARVSSYQVVQDTHVFDLLDPLESSGFLSVFLCRFMSSQLRISRGWAISMRTRTSSSPPKLLPPSSIPLN
ncbi:uncharacterized protein LOC119269765 isoform X1 [Triticum dicoccoides]|uniref:uncharacterized protein LOC119269765 isoform X1 n=1 Tax=Triticum dicoccoides TaxID=85692 RepID=UPI00188E9D3B|nr:uncharacterized protein LOC119269765 isoform X1 [Triticum dicoccoides]